MAMTLKMNFGYEDSDKTRSYSFEIDEEIAASCKGKIKALNASLSAGTDSGLSSFFIGENQENFTGITYAAIESSYTEVLDISGGED